MSKNNKTLKTVLITFITTVILMATLVVVLFFTLDFPYKKFLRVVSIIETTYVEDYDRELAEEYAIIGALSSIGDDYAEYFNTENIGELTTLLEGQYVGIGAEVFANSEKKRIEIISVYEDSPAEKAGIKGGDLIKAVDGKEYSNTELSDAVLYLKGAGIENAMEKDVKITIIREDKEIDITLRRENVNMYKVKSQIIDDICYIRYSGFTESSYAEFNSIVKNLDSSVKGIVVDIRNNPGGELNSAIDMCSIFLDEKVVMYTLDKDGDKTVYKAKSGAIDIPLAVIVNGNSASASEVFAGAIKAHKRGTIIGEKTYGKGVTQSLVPLKPFNIFEGVVKITTYKNYTPDGVWIDEGIVPDVEVPAPKVEGDIAKDQAFIEAVKSIKKDK